MKEHFSIETMKYINELAEVDDFVTMGINFNDASESSIEGLYKLFGVGEAHKSPDGLRWATWKKSPINILAFPSTLTFNLSVGKGYIE